MRSRRMQVWVALVAGGADGGRDGVAAPGGNSWSFAGGDRQNKLYSFGL